MIFLFFYFGVFHCGENHLVLEDNIIWVQLMMRFNDDD